MKKRTRLWALLAITGVAVGCGLSYGDLASTTSDGGVAPTGTNTGPSPTGSSTTPPSDDGGPPLDATTAADASSPVDAGADAEGDARPPPTSVPPRIVLRFELNYPCDISFSSYCTRNEGSFTERAVYRGVKAEFASTPGGAFGTNLNFWRANLGAPSGNAVDIDNATDAMPLAGAVERLTVAAWVRRSPETTADRENVRIVSMGPVTGIPLFEFGYNKNSETKLIASIGEPLSNGKKTSAKTLILAEEWTFVAVTYEPTAADELCFYRGTEATEVVLVECVNYDARSFTRAMARFSAGNAAAKATRDGAQKVSLSGVLDNVFVYFGDALDLFELRKLQRD